MDAALWQRVLDRLREEAPVEWAVIRSADPPELASGELQVPLPVDDGAVPVEILADEYRLARVEGIVSEVLGEPVRLRIIRPDESSAPDPTETEPEEEAEPEPEPDVPDDTEPDEESDNPPAVRRRGDRTGVFAGDDVQRIRYNYQIPPAKGCGRGNRKLHPFWERSKLREAEHRRAEAEAATRKKNLKS